MHCVPFIFLRSDYSEFCGWQWVVELSKIENRARGDAIADVPDMNCEDDKTKLSVVYHSEAIERIWTSSQEKEFFI